MARIRRIAAIAVAAAILFGSLPGCVKKQPEKSWTEEDITGFLSNETVGYPGDNFADGIEGSYILFRNVKSRGSNYDYPSYFLFESAQEAKRVFDEYASKAKENGWTLDGNMLSLSREGEYDGEVRRAFDCLYLSGNLIIMFDYTYAGDDEELVGMYNKTIEEIPEWIKTTFGL